MSARQNRNGVQRRVSTRGTVDDGVSYDLREGLQPRRVTNAMWDFSFLFGHYPGGPFEDWDRALDELLERGFNTVRIDCFPWLAGQLKDEHELITIPATPLANWGYSDTARQHALVDELVEFMTLTKRKGIHVILSTWGCGCAEYAGAAVYGGMPEAKGPELTELFRAGWERILRIFSERDLLSHVLFVDLDQEFPHFSCHNAQLSRLGEASGAGMEAAGGAKRGVGLLWNEAQLGFVTELFENTLSHFQWLYPEQRFTFSLTSFWREVRALNLKCLDVLELHIWIGQRFDVRTGFCKMAKSNVEQDYQDYQRRITAALKVMRPMLLQEMINKLAFASEWAKESAAPLITTEAWGPWCSWERPEIEWDWFRDWCAECMALAAKFGFWGVTTWNCAQPHWKNWSSKDWYREVNGAFLRS
ncbi:MAG: cellulase-like family protein [Kiritimatiellae bacterium]|nr:cellulase-like family protein [Kiritimatiellia bacterium]